MCLVNNVPHLQFRNPPFDTLQNGYFEVAEIKEIYETLAVLAKVVHTKIYPDYRYTPKSRKGRRIINYQYKPKKKRENKNI